MHLRTWLGAGGLALVVGCGSPVGPERAPSYVAGPAPCPYGTSLHVERRPELTLAHCLTPRGRVHGWRASYWPNGRRALFGEYRHGLPHGVLTTWHPNGTRSMQSRWVAGRREGRSAKWYPTGQLSSTVPWVAGVKHGVQLDYYPSGDPMSRARFDDGMQEGELLAWYRGGGVQVHGRYERGLAQGRWLYLDPSGEVDAVVHWRDGVEVMAPRPAVDVASAR